MDDALRTELTAMFDADTAAVTAFYAQVVLDARPGGAGIGSLNTRCRRQGGVARLRG